MARCQSSDILWCDVGMSLINHSDSFGGQLMSSFKSSTHGHELSSCDTHCFSDCVIWDGYALSVCGKNDSTVTVTSRPALSGDASVTRKNLFLLKHKDQHNQDASFHVEPLTSGFLKARGKKWTVSPVPHLAATSAANSGWPHHAFWMMKNATFACANDTGPDQLNSFRF